MADRLFEFVKWALKSQYRKPKVYGMDNYDENVPGIFLSNHERFFGPITVTTRFPVPVRQWATSVIVDTEEAKKYIKDTLFVDTLHFPDKLATAWGNFAAHPVSWAIRNANPIAAYQDKKRSALSIVNGLKAIEAGENQLMFAPNKKPYDDSFEFMQGYTMLAKLSAVRLGITPPIYPVALCKKRASIYIGKPTVINSDKLFKHECERVNNYIITQIRKGYDIACKKNKK